MCARLRLCMCTHLCNGLDWCLQPQPVINSPVSKCGKVLLHSSVSPSCYISPECYTSHLSPDTCFGSAGATSASHAFLAGRAPHGCHSEVSTERSTARRPPTITDTVILGKYSRPECGTRCLPAVRSHTFQKLQCDPPRLSDVHDPMGSANSVEHAGGPKSLHATEQTHESINSPPQGAPNSDGSRLCCA